MEPTSYSRVIAVMVFLTLRGFLCPVSYLYSIFTPSRCIFSVPDISGTRTTSTSKTAQDGSKANKIDVELRRFV